MKFSKLKFLCDENIDPEVINFMRDSGLDTLSAQELKLTAKDDKEVLKKSLKTKRVIITHDNDFGKIIYSGKVRFIGIIYLRPGHYDAQFTITAIKTLMKSNLDFEPQFILVAEQKADTIKIRLRNSL